MTLFNKIKSWVTGAPEPVVHVMTPSAPEKLQQPVPTWLTLRTWVITPKGLGIVVDLSSLGEIGVMIVTRDTGENIGKHNFEINVIRRAYIDELPTLRPRGPDETFLQLGYTYGPQRT